MVGLDWGQGWGFAMQLPRTFACLALASVGFKPDMLGCVWSFSLCPGRCAGPGENGSPCFCQMVPVRGAWLQAKGTAYQGGRVGLVGVVSCLVGRLVLLWVLSCCLLVCLVPRVAVPLSCTGVGKGATGRWWAVAAHRGSFPEQRGVGLRTRCRRWCGVVPGASWWGFCLLVGLLAVPLALAACKAAASGAGKRPPACTAPIHPCPS